MFALVHLWDRVEWYLDPTVFFGFKDSTLGAIETWLQSMSFWEQSLIQHAPDDERWNLLPRLQDIHDSPVLKTDIGHA